MTTTADKPLARSSGPLTVQIPFEALAESIPAAADGTIVQLGPAVDPFVFEIVDLGDVVVTRDTYGSDMSLVARGRSDAVTIAGAISVPGPGRWDDLELEAGMWAAYGTGGVHASTARIGHVNAEIVIDVGTIDEAIVAMGRGPLAMGTAASQLGPHEAARVAAIHRMAGFDGTRSDPTSVRHVFLDMAARIFSSDSRSNPRGTRWLSSKQIVMTALEYAGRVHDRRPTVLELCRATAASERRLMYAFEEVAGISPRRYLTFAVMNHVRTHLIEASPGAVGVGHIALGHGFHHLGRFASDYRHLYGELPSDTLKRCHA